MDYVERNETIMNLRRQKLVAGAGIVLLLTVLSSMTVFAAETDAPLSSMYATAWALVPPIIAIGLALITKEVYSSLLVGIVVGALLGTDFHPVKTVESVFKGGFISVLSDEGNIGIIMFLVILGIMVSMMNKAGGSAAFGKWAGEHIKSRAGAQLATIGLGILIFIDDYFNCLTVGSVMRPVTDKHKISRAKLAYLIDSTAAPICIIAPISSWAAAVAGFVEGEDGLSIFVRAIPYNFYALLTIIMMLGIVYLKMDYGSMKLYEKNAKNGDLFTAGKRANGTEDVKEKPNGRVLDLVFPILVLIVCCVTGMLYTGEFFSGAAFVEAFSQSDAPSGLAMGSFFGLVITIVYYLLRRALKFRECMECVPEGFQSMVPAILILTFAWTLKAMTDQLGADVFVATAMESCAEGLMNLLPAIIFLVGCFLAFATGTSWGTFGILIPIVVKVFEQSNPTLMIIAISACMAGAVCGDHCSPISDTTIMASAGAQCDHVSHVATQLPYALTVAAVSFVSYIVAGFTQSAWISLPFGIVLLGVVLLVIKKYQKKIQN